MWAFDEKQESVTWGQEAFTVVRDVPRPGKRGLTWFVFVLTVSHRQGVSRVLTFGDTGDVLNKKYYRITFLSVTGWIKRVWRDGIRACEVEGRKREMNWGKRRIDEQKMRQFHQKMEGKKGFCTEMCIDMWYICKYFPAHKPFKTPGVVCKRRADDSWFLTAGRLTLACVVLGLLFFLGQCNLFWKRCFSKWCFINLFT